MGFKKGESLLKEAHGFIIPVHYPGVNAWATEKKEN
jgi:hypothetical protein